MYIVRSCAVEQWRSPFVPGGDYYASDDAFIQQPTGHSKATGASTGIIGMLEVIESARLLCGGRGF